MTRIRSAIAAIVRMIDAGPNGRPRDRAPGLFGVRWEMNRNPDKRPGEGFTFHLVQRLA